MAEQVNDAGTCDYLAFKTGAKLSEPLRLLGAEGQEGIGELFEVRVLLARSAALSDSEIADLFEKPCAVVFDRGEYQFMCGILAELVHVDNSMTEARYVAKVVPRAQTMSLSRASRAIVQQSISEAFEGLVKLHGVNHGKHLTSTYPKRDLMVQYKESDWDFLSRWAEYFGINMWFSHSAKGDSLHWGDDLSKVESVLPTFQMSHVQRSMLQLADPVIAVFDEVYRRGPWRAVVHDHSEVSPASPPAYEAHGTKGWAMGTRFAYAEAKFGDETEGKRIAKRRVERMEIERCFYRGQTNEAGLRSASWLDIQKKSGAVKKYLVTRTRFVVGFPPSRAAATGKDNVKPLRYHAHFHAIDAARPHRPKRRTSWPVVSGVQLGYVAGEALGAGVEGDKARQARPDGEGRYRVALPFVSPNVEAAGLGSMQMTPPLRVSQTVSGNVEGAQAPLRLGTPVLLAFHDGNPDRPYVVGCIEHEQTQHVVGSHSAYQGVMQSAARVRLEWADQPGEEEPEGGGSEAGEAHGGEEE